MPIRDAEPLRFRQVHLDFHTGPFVPDVGADFDARAFARAMKRARVDSVTVFAKCHHGHLYYDTDDPARHPGLSRKRNLLEEQVEALHREGIRAPIYLSVMCDEYAANLHPEWVALEPDGKRVGRPPLSDAPFAWQILDMSSPYQEYLARQTAEVLERFKPVDGIFFDMCWDQPSVGHFAKAAMERAGFDAERDEDRYRHAHAVALAYMNRFYEMVKRRGGNPRATVFFNGRSIGNTREEWRWQSQSEIESLPTGGWGYLYFPKHVRFARNFPPPTMGMTARFHKSWADFGGLKPYAALEYETSQMMAQGARCSIGDQLHPRGTLDAAAYDLIGRVYERVAAREPWLAGAQPVAEVAVLQADERPTGQGGRVHVAGAEEGAIRMLNHLNHQFDLIDRPADFQKYALLILPDAVRVDGDLARKLRAFLKGGGRLLATGTSGFADDGARLALPELGIKAHGPSPFQTTYVRFGREIGDDVPATDHAMYERGVRVTAAAGSTTLARVVEPYFDRTWKHFSSHAQTPPRPNASTYAAAVQRGAVAYVAYPIFTAFARHGNVPYRLLVRNLIDRLLPEPLLRVDGPSNVETSVTRQGKRTIVHLLYYVPERRTEKLDIVEDVVPLFDVPMSLKLPRAPKRVYAAPDETAVPFKYLARRVNLRVPVVRGHAMIVFE